jgi:hypothetical protein
MKTKPKRGRPLSKSDKLFIAWTVFSIIIGGLVAVAVVSRWL